MNYLYPIEKAFEKRQALFDDSGTNCFRLFHSAADGIDGLSIDRYGQYFLVQFFNDGLFQDVKNLSNSITGALQRLPVEAKGVLLKDRRKSTNHDTDGDRYRSILIDGERPPREYTVIQNGILSSVDLVSGQHTGLFLDMREIRRNLHAVYAEADNMLNLFCYTAVFSVHGLLNGVRHAVNIDLSKPALERARRNYELNLLNWRPEDFIHGDSFDWIKLFLKKNRHFPLVIFDPPTFARNKKRSFSIKRDYRHILDQISRIAAGGLVLSCVNASAVTEKEYLSFHPSGWKNLFLGYESPDFPILTEPYLKAGLWSVQ